MATSPDFDLLLSFAGTERRYAQAIHAICAANGLRVFLDEEFQHEIWGANLVEYLDKTYRERGKYCLVLMSKSYRERAYTRVERHAALDRMIEANDPYLLPVTVDGDWIDGLPRSTAYLDLRVHGVIGICEMLMKKISPGTSSRLVVPDNLAVPRVPLGTLPAEQLSAFLLELCRKQPVAAFGALIYNEETVELRKLLTDQDYWDALDAASGPELEVFALRDEVRVSVKGGMPPSELELMRPFVARRVESRATFFSKLLRNYLGVTGRPL
ncbi:MAG TPA: toll/interleukin-1 receptor domain-containing protein [Gemmataceae bacterium]|nr:toll/interleukin-1 receptor domain-containing protein [Gemmataceae bacterium]